MVEMKRESRMTRREEETQVSASEEPTLARAEEPTRVPGRAEEPTKAPGLVTSGLMRDRAEVPMGVALTVVEYKP